MAFDPNDPRITAYVFEELSEEQRVAFEAELKDSEKLQAAVENTRRTIQLLADDLGAEPSIPLSDSQRQAVDEAIGEVYRQGESPFAAKPAAGGRKTRWGLLVGLLALGASLLVASPWLVQVRDRVALTSTGRQPRTAALRSRIGDRNSNVAPAGKAGDDSVYFTKPPTSAAPVGGGASPIAVSPDGSVVVAEKTRRANELLQGELESTRRQLEIARPSQLLAEKESQLAVGARAAAKSERESRRGAIVAKPTSRGAMLASNSDRTRGLAASPERKLPSKAYLADDVPYFPAPASPAKPPRPDDGIGPGYSGDQYQPIQENPFVRVKDQPRSTFSIDVDTASYAKVRMYLMQNNTFPRPDAVRIEELINYFTYDYQPPTNGEPFASHVEVADCPWAQDHRLVRVGIKGREIDNEQRPASNLVFLLDVSGSMNRPNKLPLLKRGMKMLVDQLGENDRVAIVVYAGAAGLVLDSTPGDHKQTILDALERLQAGGSTNGGQGIQLAYQTALDNFIAGGVNRVILCTDGDFNVGVTGLDSLVRMAEENARTGVFLSVLGFGMGNHNDAMLEQISNKGNGNYAFIDSDAEARRVLVEQMSGTLVTIAKDVKIQVEFNPLQVAAYRLIGYENRLLAAEDFNDDTKDAGEIGAGHTVTALYEIISAGTDGQAELAPEVDELYYQKTVRTSKAAESGELMLLKIRSKEPDKDESTKQEFHITDQGKRFGQTDADFRFAAAVASFGMLLRNSQYKGTATFAGVEEIAREAATGDKTGYRKEFLEMVAKARQLSGE